MARWDASLNSAIYYTGELSRDVTIKKGVSYEKV